MYSEYWCATEACFYKRAHRSAAVLPHVYMVVAPPVVVDTKIVKSVDIGTWVSCEWYESSEKLALAYYA